MSNNVDYLVCPECDALNAAQWNPRGRRSYDVTCSVCGFEHEHGHYESFRNLTWEQFISEATAESIREYLAEEIGSIYDRDDWDDSEDWRDIPY